MDICKKSLDFYLRGNISGGEKNLHLPLFMKIQEHCAACNEHLHDFMELVIVMEGSADLICNDFRCRVGLFDVFVIPPGVSHSYDNCSNMRIANIMFDQNKLSLPKFDLPLLPGYHLLFMANEYFADNKSVPMFKLPPSQAEGIMTVIKMMDGECRHQRQGVNFRMMGLFMVLLGNLAAAGSVSPVSSRADQTGQIGKLVAFMNSEFHRKIGYDDLLKLVPMSRSTLNRNFIRATGESPMRYLLNLRLEHAAKLLSLTEMPIAEIAVASGFEDSNYFSRVFHKVYHISPRTYRSMPIPVLDC